MINKKIAELIVRAQNASDGGKHLYPLINSRRAYRDNCVGYRQKDKMILTAIKLIVANKGKCDFKFAVVDDVERVAYYIVYFETKVNGEKVQVSFHSFDYHLRDFLTNSFRIKWDRKDSRKSAMLIYNAYSYGDYANLSEEDE